MEKLIVIEENDKYKFNNLKELVLQFIDNNYYNLSLEERKKLLEKKAFTNTFLDNIKIELYDENIKNSNLDSFIIYDEFVYILCMLKFNKLFLLERIEANIFGKYIDKENINDNYIIVNTFANEILKKYLGEIKNG